MSNSHVCQGCHIFIRDYSTLASTMSLNDEERKELDFAIDNAMKYVTEMRFLYRQEEVKSELQIRDEIDFLFGYIWGMILTTFRVNYKSRFNRTPTDEQQTDVVRIMRTMAKDLRDRITGTP